MAKSGAARQAAYRERAKREGRLIDYAEQRKRVLEFEALFGKPIELFHYLDGRWGREALQRAVKQWWRDIGGGLVQFESADLYEREKKRPTRIAERHKANRELR